MHTPENVQRIETFALQVADFCAEQVHARVAKSGTWYDDDPTGILLEQSVLALILTGLMERAEQKGVDWAKVQEDAQIARSGFPVTQALQ